MATATGSGARSSLVAALAARGIHYGWLVVGVTFLALLVGAGRLALRIAVGDGERLRPGTGLGQFCGEGILAAAQAPRDHGKRRVRRVEALEERQVGIGPLGIDGHRNPSQEIDMGIGQALAKAFADKLALPILAA
jgi:hypothetical protein